MPLQFASFFFLFFFFFPQISCIDVLNKVIIVTCQHRIVTTACLENWLKFYLGIISQPETVWVKCDNKITGFMSHFTYPFIKSLCLKMMIRHYVL